LEQCEYVQFSTEYYSQRLGKAVREGCPANCLCRRWNCPPPGIFTERWPMFGTWLRGPAGAAWLREAPQAI